MKVSYVVAGGLAVGALLFYMASQKQTVALQAYNSASLGQRLKSLVPAWLK
jgi:hypothetical protein